jgi:hypothetical protein
MFGAVGYSTVCDVGTFFLVTRIAFWRLGRGGPRYFKRSALVTERYYELTPELNRHTVRNLVTTLNRRSCLFPLTPYLGVGGVLNYNGGLKLEVAGIGVVRWVLRRRADYSRCTRKGGRLVGDSINRCFEFSQNRLNKKQGTGVAVFLRRTWRISCRCVGWAGFGRRRVARGVLIYSYKVTILCAPCKL